MAAPRIPTIAGIGLRVAAVLIIAWACTFAYSLNASTWDIGVLAVFGVFGVACKMLGWNRLVLQVPDLAATVERLRGAGVPFRNEIVTGPGGQQILIEDPSGNPIELFQPA